MGHRQIRVGQLIAPFGPGSIYTDRRGVPHIVCGLDHWYKRPDVHTGLAECDHPEEFTLFEPRLAELLNVDTLKAPPDFRSSRKGQKPPPNAFIQTPALRFPRWYRHSKTGKLKKFNLASQKVERAPEGGRWLPVRFVAACDAGHLSEFPWKAWIGCICAGDGDLHLTDRGGSELTSIRIECHSCAAGSSGRKGRDLSRTTMKPNRSLGEQSEFEKIGISCPGERPWLGDGAEDPTCQSSLVGALINQTNLYSPRTISAILLPDMTEKDDTVLQIRNYLESKPALAGIAKMVWAMGRAGAVALVQADLMGIDLQAAPDEIEKALESLFRASGSVGIDAPAPTAPESEMLRFRRVEFNVIREQVLDAVRIPDLRVIPVKPPQNLADWFARVNLVERLGETRVFYGFDRLSELRPPLAGMPEAAMTQLFRDPPEHAHKRWLPAVRVYGEGIYIELRDDAIRGWQSANEAWLRRRLHPLFIERLQGQSQVLPPSSPPDWVWASRYLLVHSLAHILIAQLVFECGYSTASLRERLYVSDDPAAPMAGLLIYTAAGDSEGTLGGLVRLGHPERLGSVVRRALSRASWCSADPVCSENLGGQGAQLANLAACHSCTLLPETSCETINHGLDRAMLVGTPSDRDGGAFGSLLELVPSLG